MQINKEPNEKHSIQSYTDAEVKINAVTYSQNLIVNQQQLLSNWNITALNDLSLDTINPLLSLEPEVIIIGHNGKDNFPPMPMLQQLSQMRIGIECMSIGAACRTYNLLLSEDRKVVLGIIF
jgi:uncharacterized protein